MSGKTAIVKGRPVSEEYLATFSICVAGSLALEIGRNNKSREAGNDFMQGSCLARSTCRAQNQSSHPLSSFSPENQPGPCTAMGCEVLSLEALLTPHPLDLPTLAEFRVDELLGSAVTARLESLGIPVESAPGTPGRICQEHSFS